MREQMCSAPYRSKSCQPHWVMAVTAAVVAVVFRDGLRTLAAAREACDSAPAAVPAVEPAVDVTSPADLLPPGSASPGIRSVGPLAPGADATTVDASVSTCGANEAEVRSVLGSERRKCWHPHRYRHPFCTRHGRALHNRPIVQQASRRCWWPRSIS